MAGWSINDIPSNFFDITSDILLTQPEPDYLYADWFKGALSLSLSVPGEMGLPGRTISGNGASYSDAERDRLILSGSMLPAEVMAASLDFSGKPGATIRLNRPVFTDSTVTEASRRIPSGTTISTTAIAPGEQQTNLTLHRYGGPYSSTVQPYAIEAFDAQFGVHKAASMVGTHLKRDFDRFINAVMVSLLDLAASTLYPEGMSAANDATAVGSFPMTVELVFRTEKTMNEAKLPRFSDGYRCLVLHPTQVMQLKNDLQYQRAAQNFPQYSILFPNYVASIGRLHIFESNNLTSAANSSSVTVYTGHAIAPGVLMGGMGAANRRPRVAPNTNDNYGETALVVWLADLAFGLANNAFVYKVASSA